jgi:hypothetical protein
VGVAGGDTETRRGGDKERAPRWVRFARALRGGTFWKVLEHGAGAVGSFFPGACGAGKTGHFRASAGISGHRRAFAGTGGTRRGGGGLGRVWARDGRSVRACGPSVLLAVLRSACTGSATRGGECALATQEWGWWGGFLASEVLRAPRPGAQWVSCARKEGAQSQVTTRQKNSDVRLRLSVRRMSDVPLRLPSTRPCREHSGP